MKDMPRSVEWRDNTLVLLDQRKLPQIEEVVLCTAIEEVFDGIKTDVIGDLQSALPRLTDYW